MHPAHAAKPVFHWSAKDGIPEDWEAVATKALEGVSGIEVVLWKGRTPAVRLVTGEHQVEMVFAVRRAAGTVSLSVGIELALAALKVVCDAQTRHRRRRRKTAHG
jgi:hypothetical protein